jgi:uncharacterized membrane protein
MSPRTLKIACAVSLLLNVFLISAVIGGAAWIQERRPAVTGSIRVAGAQLPPKQRRIFREALRDARREMQPALADGRRAREDATALLRAPKLDTAALTAALARVRAADVTVRAHVEERAVAVAASLSSADRETLAQGIVRRADRPGRQ